MLWEPDDTAFRALADRRSVLVFATDRGRDLHGEVRPRVDAAYAELRASIDDDEWDRLIIALERLGSIESETPDARPAVNQ